MCVWTWAPRWQEGRDSLVHSDSDSETGFILVHTSLYSAASLRKSAATIPFTQVKQVGTRDEAAGAPAAAAAAAKAGTGSSPPMPRCTPGGGRATPGAMAAATLCAHQRDVEEGETDPRGAR